MKPIIIIALTAIFIVSCGNSRQVTNPGIPDAPAGDTLITQSLFNDRSSTISEDNIQKILDGSFQIPQHLNVTIVRLRGNEQRNYYWNDEEYLKNQQSYLDFFEEQLRQSARVKRISIIPDLLISKTPGFTSIREAAVRMQADLVVIYSVTSDLYSKYRLFTKPDIKAFATIQLIILDVRTGLIPFSIIKTRDYLSRKKKEELDFMEAKSRVTNEAVLLTIKEIGEQVSAFLKSN